MSINKTLAAVAFSAAVLASAQASATIVFSTPAAPTGPTSSTYESFTTQTVGTAPANDTFGTYSGSGTVIQNTTVNGQFVIPGGLTSGVDNYLAVQGGGTETVTLATTGNVLGLLWGSIDSYNTLTLATSSGPVTITGLTLEALDPAIIDATSTEYVTLSGYGTITGFTMTSLYNSFETDEYAVSTAIPETSTWAMMLLGFASVGFFSYRSRNKMSSLRLA
jgi:hypothetical protein